MANSSTPSAKRRRLDFSEDITVAVGEGEKQEKRYTVHENIITKHSEFFRAACNGDFKEAKEKLVRLPEIEPATFEYFLQWCYTGEVVVINEEDIDDPERKIPLKQYAALVRLYSLADQYGDVRLRNATIDQIVEVHSSTQHFPGPDKVRDACGTSRPRSNLRKLLADYYNHYNNVDWFVKCKDELLADFYFEMVLRKKEGVNDYPNLSNKCRYHEHNDEVPKCS